jgi:hypothetical protein
MDRPFEIAEEVVIAYDTTRRAGHTMAMLVGATLANANIVVANRNQIDVIDGMRASRAPSGTYLLPHEVLDMRRGISSRPLVFDHHAMTLLLHSMIREHTVSTRMNSRLKDALVDSDERAACAERGERRAQWELIKTNVAYGRDKSRWWYKLCKRIFK